MIKIIKSIILIILGFILYSVIILISFWTITNQYPPKNSYILFFLIYFLISSYSIINYNCNYESSQTIIIKNEKKENIELIECVICLEEIPNHIKIYDLDCKHVFHIECIEQWKNYGTTCPLCRADIKIEIG